MSYNVVVGCPLWQKFEDVKKPKYGFGDPLATLKRLGSPFNYKNTQQLSVQDGRQQKSEIC